MLSYEYCSFYRRTESFDEDISNLQAEINTDGYT